MTLIKEKKLKYFLLFTLLFIPINVLAYSEYLIPGGENIGIELNSDGIIVVDFYEVNGENYVAESNLAQGDVIKSVNGIKVYTSEDLLTTISADCTTASITYSRNNKEYKTDLKLISDDGECKTGIYIKDKVSGIGTLTYIDPQTNLYGALGHEVLEKTSGNLLDMKSGSIHPSTVTSINKSSNGVPGEKNAIFDNDSLLGSIDENTIQGIYGEYSSELPNKTLLEVANPEDIKIGDATIRTVLDGSEIKEYTINIIKINKDYSEQTKNILFEITDSRLLEQTGGIVQGMSGSPIIQNNKIVGAVTHVIVDNPTNGYGIFITNMLEQGEN